MCLKLLKAISHHSFSVGGGGAEYPPPILMYRCALALVEAGQDKRESKEPSRLHMCRILTCCLASLRLHEAYPTMWYCGSCEVRVAVALRLMAVA